MKKIWIITIAVLLLAVGVVSADRVVVELAEVDDSGASGTGTIRRIIGNGQHKIIVDVRVQDVPPEPGRIFEGWLVDDDSGHKLSLGSFQTRRNGRGNLRFRQNIVNPLVYDTVVITKEPLNDIDPNPAGAVLEGPISDSIGTLVQLSATLNGRQETALTRTRGKGTGAFFLNTVANRLFYNISYHGLTGNETAAHIHGFALPRVNAGILEPLPFGTPKIGVWVITEEQQTEIIAGLTYVNVHTTIFPPGEIRGQIELTEMQSQEGGGAG